MIYSAFSLLYTSYLVKYKGASYFVYWVYRNGYVLCQLMFISLFVLSANTKWVILCIKKECNDVICKLICISWLFCEKLNGSFAFIIQKSRETQQVSVSVCFNYLYSPFSGRLQRHGIQLDVK